MTDDAEPKPMTAQELGLSQRQLDALAGLPDDLPSDLVLWNAIHDYVRACGGDPEKHVYGNTARQAAVVRIEAMTVRLAGLSAGLPAHAPSSEEQQSCILTLDGLEPLDECPRCGWEARQHKRYTAPAETVTEPQRENLRLQVAYRMGIEACVDAVLLFREATAEQATLSRSSISRDIWQLQTNQADAIVDTLRSLAAESDS